MNYFIQFKSESGDLYEPWFLLTKPTEEELKEMLAAENFGLDGWGGPDGEGPGIFGSWVYIEKEGETQ
jgi:hypothetical protein